ncbi:hypothetical protein ACFY2V_04755 [Streptomyces eurythermus]|uniref:hypothetical protein n=1 Tax=Streptomyces eurythermus TaxID=42237 RepID=UPI0036CECDDC
MMKTLKSASLAVAMSVAAIGLTTGTASALTHGCAVSSNDAGGLDCWVQHEESGWGAVDSTNFYAYGERLYLSDLLNNGKGVGAYVEGTWYRHTGEAYEGTEYNLSFEEGRSISVKACQTDNGSIYDCYTEYARA